MPIVELTSALAPVAEAISVLPTQDVFSWVNEKGAQAETAIKVIIGVVLLIFSIVLMIKVKFRIGGILGGLAVLALAAWITLGGGWKFGSDVVDDSVNSSATTTHEIPSGEV